LTQISFKIRFTFDLYPTYRLSLTNLHNYFFIVKEEREVN